MGQLYPVFRIVFYALLILLIAGGCLYLFGPRTVVDTTIRFDPHMIGNDPQAYLDASEARYPDIRPGAQKQIVWINPAAKTKTPLAIVYIHGFSASAGEIRPLPDRVAAALGANLYYTRLAGHGRSGDAMAQASVNDWVNDFAESLAIGEMLGDKVVIMATSTGASLATWALADPAFSGRVAAAVFFSPNYGINNPGAPLLTLPFAKSIARLAIGERRSLKPANALQAAIWTSDYPTEALLPMAELVKLAVASPIEEITTPALFVYSSFDAVVRPDRIRQIAGRWGGAHQIVDVGRANDPDNHVITGDAMSPATTGPLSIRVMEWLKHSVSG